MDPAVVIFVVVVVLIASTAQAVAGFGFSLVAVPFLIIVLDVKDVVVISTLLGIANSALVARVTWRHAPPRTVLTMLAGSYVGMPVGLVVLLYAPEDGLRLAVGIASIVMASALALGASVGAAGRGGELFAGVTSGVLNTSVGMNGPPVVLYLQDRLLPPLEFRAALSTFFLGNTLVTLPLFAASGILSMTPVILSAASLPAVWGGNALGHLLLQRVSPGHFRRLVLGLLIATALTSAAIAVARIAG